MDSDLERAQTSEPCYRMHKIDYVAQVKDILNLKRNLNSIIGSKITAILFDACILPIHRVA